MEERKIYNLKSFKLVVVGLVISTVISNGIALLTRDSIPIQIVGGILQIISWILIFMGIKAVKEYSRFDKCYRAALWLIGISVGILAAVFISSAISYALLLIASILSIVFALVALGFGISFYYNLFKGIEKIALQFKETAMAKRADTLWLVYIWTAIISVCCAPIAVVIFSNSKMIISIVSIIQAIINVIICIFFYKFYNMFDGREIPTEPSDSEEIVSSEILRI